MPGTGMISICSDCMYPNEIIYLDWFDRSDNEKGFNIYMQVAGADSQIKKDSVGPNVTADDIRTLPPGALKLLMPCIAPLSFSNQLPV